MSLASTHSYRPPSYIDELDRDVFPFISYPGYPDRYPALEPLAQPEFFYHELRRVSQELWQVYARAVAVFQKCPEEFMAMMDMPRALRPFLDLPNPLGLPTYLSRFDYVLDGRGHLRCLELNADTPCAVVESYYANAVAARHFHASDPNAGEKKRLTALLGKIAAASPQQLYEPGTGRLTERPFVFSCFPEYAEDFATTEYLRHALPAGVEGEFVSFYDLAVDEQGLLLPDGRYAGILYRLHPLELLIEETAADGYRLGEQLLRLVAEGRLVLFNPPEAIIVQSKGFQALLWALYEQQKFLTPAERRVLERHLPPSYFEEDRERLRGRKYLEKPIWGREGRGITLYDEEGRALGAKEQAGPTEAVERESCASLCQEFIESRKSEVLTDSGRLSGFMTYSCFMCGEEPSAVYARFSPEAICGTESYWVPLVY